MLDKNGIKTTNQNTKPDSIVQPIEGGVFPGRIIKVKGKISARANKFVIYVHSKRPDTVALAVDFRFKNKSVYRYQIIDKDYYGSPEATDGITLKPGDLFVVQIQCDLKVMKITIEDMYFCEFRHRMPYDDISHVTVNGDVELDPVDPIWINKELASPTEMPYQTTPCVDLVEGGFFVGRFVRLHGKLHTDAKKFTVNLQCNPHDEVALHLEFHFNEKQRIKQDSEEIHEKRAWVKEEKSVGMPLMLPVSFELRIICKDDVWQIVVNDKPFCDFQHRVQFERVSHVGVSGDVHLQTMSFEGKP